MVTPITTWRTCICWPKTYQKALDYLNQAESHGVTVNPKMKEAVLKGLGK